MTGTDPQIGEVTDERQQRQQRATRRCAGSGASVTRYWTTSATTSAIPMLRLDVDTHAHSPATAQRRWRAASQAHVAPAKKSPSE